MQNEKTKTTPPRWSQQVYESKAYTIGEWLDRMARIHGIAPGDEFFAEAFKHRFQMDWPYWEQERDAHLRAFTRV